MIRRLGYGARMASFTDLELRTGRLLLRPLREPDAAALFAIFSDPEVMLYWSSPAWASPDQAAQLILRELASAAVGESVRLGLVRLEDDALIGTCSLFHLDVQSRRAEIGYALARTAWRQGYVQEAVGALIEYAFTVLDLNRLEADIDPDNEASARSLDRLGFQLEGLLRERWIVAGRVSDSALYGLLRREWAATSPAREA
jgi:ribosomal-protein-alanine N-acetyltransferase